MSTVRITAKEARKARLTQTQKKRLDALTDAEITAAAESDSDNPPLTRSELAKLRRGGRPPMPPNERRASITLRLPPRVIEHFRSTGPGWQTRIGDVLERHVARRK